MPTRWQDKGIGVLSKRGQSDRKRILNEKDGSTAGYHTEHWDGSQDAEARPKTIRVKAKLIQEER